MLIPLTPETAKSGMSLKGSAPTGTTPVDGAEEFALALHPSLPAAEPEPKGGEEASIPMSETADSAEETALPEKAVAVAVDAPPAELAFGTSPDKSTSGRGAAPRAGTAAPIAISERPGNTGAKQMAALETSALPTTDRANTGQRLMSSAPLALLTAAPEPAGEPAAKSSSNAITALSPPSNATPTTQEEAAMQLSRPTRLRSLPISSSRPAPGSGIVVPQQAATPSEASAVRAVDAVPEKPQGSPDRQETQAKGSQAGQHPAPHQSASSTAQAPAQAAGADRSGAHGAGSPIPSEPRAPAVTHAVVSYDIRPSQVASPPPIPQILAAYAPFTAGQTPAITNGKGPVAAPLDEAEIEPILGRSTDAGTPGAQARQAAPPQTLHVTPEQLASQLAQIAQNSALHRREIQLNPQELGRIRMNLNAQETSVHVAILVERPETLDLMRRYIGQLTEEFQALGYQDVSFDFAQHRQEGEPAQASEDGFTAPSTAQEEHFEAAPPPPPQRPAPTGLLDLRI